MAGMRLGLMVGLLALAGCKMPMAQHPASVTMPAIYLVFFHPASADITPVGKQIVDQAAAKVKESKPSTVTIAGYTADVGDPDEKLHMANQRIPSCSCPSPWDRPTTAPARPATAESKSACNMAGERPNLAFVTEQASWH